MKQSLNITIDAYLLHCQTSGITPKSLRSYSDILKDFANFHGDIFIDTLSPEKVNSYLANVASRQGIHGMFSPSSTHKYYTVVHTFLKWIYGKGYISLRFIDQIIIPIQSQGPIDILSDGEKDMLYEYLVKKGNPRDYLIFEIFLETGVRTRELSNLNVDDVYINKKWLKVVDKTGMPVNIPIGNKLVQHLDEYIRIHRNAEPNEHALIINKHGTRLEFDGLEMLIKRVLKVVREGGKSGGETLRNTFAISFLRNGGKILPLHNILRNKDLRSTYRFQDHINKISLRNDVEGDR